MEDASVRRFFAIFTVVAVWGLSDAIGADKPEDTPAATTRKLLETKISVDFKDARLEDVTQDIADKIKDAASVKEFKTKIDTVSGATNNMKITYTGKDQTLTEILEGIGKKFDLGYVVVSGKYKAFPSQKLDGFLMFTKGAERGYPGK
jgi:hypothetical protein